MLLARWLVSYSRQLSAYTTDVLYSSLFCKGAFLVLQITGQTLIFFCFRGMTYIALTLCFKRIRFFALLFAVFLALIM